MSVAKLDQQNAIRIYQARNKYMQILLTFVMQRESNPEPLAFQQATRRSRSSTN